MTSLIKYLVFLAIANVIAFILYRTDKKRAIRGEWRISERQLLLIGMFGGAVGAILGMKIFHHKTKRWYFWFVNIIGLIWQIGYIAMFWLAYINNVPF